MMDLSQWTPARLPERDRPLSGARVDLVPLDVGAHARGLWRTSRMPGDPDLWKYLFYGPFDSFEMFEAHLSAAVEATDHLYYAVVDGASGIASGICSYLRMKPAHGVIEIGHIWFAPPMQRTPGATEAIYLLAANTFDHLGYRRLEWKCDAANARSRRAALRFGFSFEGIFRQHLVVKGRNRDTAWYALLDRD